MLYAVAACRSTVWVRQSKINCSGGRAVLLSDDDMTTMLIWSVHRQSATYEYYVVEGLVDLTCLTLLAT